MLSAGKSSSKKKSSQGSTQLVSIGMLILNYLTSILFFTLSIQIIAGVYHGLGLLAYPVRVLVASICLVYLLCFFGVAFIWGMMEQDTREQHGVAASQQASTHDDSAPAGQSQAARSRSPPPAPASTDSDSDSSAASAPATGCTNVRLLLALLCGIVYVAAAGFAISALAAAAYVAVPAAARIAWAGTADLILGFAPQLAADSAAEALVRAGPLSLCLAGLRASGLEVLPLEGWGWSQQLPGLALAALALMLFLRERSRAARLDSELEVTRKRSDPLQLEQRARRLKHYPNLFPNSWYKLCDSTQLKRGEVKEFKVLGLTLAAFRGEESGRVTVLDAFCPHLGANMAVGGEVCGDHLKCPFHHWEFDGKGKVANVPYSTSVPPTARARKWPVRECYGMVLFFYDHEEAERAKRGEAPRAVPAQDMNVKSKNKSKAGREWEAFTPPYEPPRVRGVSDGGYTYRGAHDARPVMMHMQEFAENAADIAHFPAVHRDMTIPWTNIPLPGLTIDHTADWKEGTEEEGAHISHFMDHAQPQFLNKAIPGTDADADITFVGPGGLVFFTIELPTLGEVVMFQTHTPVSLMELKTEFRYFADPRVPDVLAHYVVGNWISQWANDLDIWENKILANRPLLVKGDGPMMRLRRWYRQFYAPGSADKSIRFEHAGNSRRQAPESKEQQHGDDEGCDDEASSRCDGGVPVDAGGSSEGAAPPSSERKVANDW